MQGPITATMRAGSASAVFIRSTVDWITPPSAPFQPAWAAATTPATGSANRMGAQSAVRTAQMIPGVVVATASPSGRSSGHPVSASRATAEWIW
jgi:hypothetical protein